MDIQPQILSREFENDLKRLCDLFEEELARQEDVYRVCCAQGEAARINDVDTLDEQTRQLVALMEAALEAEQQRLPVLQHIVSYYRLPEDNHTLTDLIQVVPQPWHGRLVEFQEKIQRVLHETQEEVRNNRSYMLAASKQMQDALTNTLQKDEKPAEGYSQDGTEAVKPGQKPAVLNTVG